MNNTSKDLKIVFYSESPDTTNLSSSQASTTVNSCGMAGGPIELSLDENDSILLFSQANSLLKAYYPTSTGKNIYKTQEFWDEEKSGKRSYIYTFEITEEDIGKTETGE